MLWHEDLADTRVGRYCLGKPSGTRRDGATKADLDDVASDAAWQPSLAARASIAMAAFVVNLPYELQQSVFEELFLCFWGIVRGWRGYQPVSWASRLIPLDARRGFVERSPDEFPRRASRKHRS